ncbi:RUN domain-containing protein 1 isoform X2 [Drosophila virilis]|uniref:Uncharacterized protein, isoform D n=1 Tax=Drosophila virilis TaxID=7244 RepID=A0A0Q9WAP2_DROVI|nr:RUN domain-containing protein 1 isoform X2 [Drosophila virilis]KRF78127.1 uncharacterized protein Dvir_GJ15356, isoform D [Drosophila virilis]
MEMNDTLAEGQQPASSTSSCDNVQPTKTTTTTSSTTTTTTTSTIIAVNVNEGNVDSQAYPETDPEADAEDEAQPLSERWSPLGANYDDANSASSELMTSGGDCAELDEPQLLGCLTLDKPPPPPPLLTVGTAGADNASELARLRSIEEEQELLTSSLLALTSQFAHVQLRVRQIVEAPTDERDQLLRDLEDFAFQGIPEVAQPNNDHGTDEMQATTAPPDGQLIEQLKSQLTELEQLAYDSGTPGVLPQHVLLEKQKFILDELRTKLNLQVEQHQLPALSTEQLRHQVDNAIGEFVGPLKMKEQLVAQLKTQITDLERFIAFLQCDTAGAGGGGSGTTSASDKLKLLSGAYNSYAAKQTARQTPGQLPVMATTSSATAAAANMNAAAGTSSAEHEPRRESLHSKAHGLLDKASLLMQMFATTHFAKRQADFQQNSLKKTHKGNHWGCENI